MLDHPSLSFCSLLSTAVCAQNRGERETLHCPSSAWTESADCKPNTLFARGKATLSVRLTLYARVHIQSPLAGVIFVVSTTSLLKVGEKHLSTFALSHLTSDASFALVPPAWSRARSLTVYLMTQLGPFPCHRWDARSSLTQPFINFTSNNSRNNWMKK